MNQRVIAILAALCVIAGTCALWYYRNAGNSTHTAKPAAAARRDALDTGTQQATAGSGPATKKVVAGKPHHSATAENLDATKSGQTPATPAFKQAFAVKLDDAIGVGRLVSPGMPVEVLVSAHPPGSDANQGSVTKTILRNIEVLSAGTYAQKNQDGTSQQIEVVNLLVTPEQAVMLSQTSAQSGILLVLRNTLGAEVYELPATAMSNSIQDRQPFGDKTVKRTVTDRDTSSSRYYAVQVINGSKTGGAKTNTVLFPLPEGMQ